MENPFDIDEIFPSEANGPARLPRRQTGNAPQGLTVSLLADYTARTRAWLPSAALVELLADAGVSAAGARAAISRLARRGALEGHRQGRHSFYRLTQATATHLSLGGIRVAAAGAVTEPWDEYWTVIAFTLPHAEGAQRRTLRTHLRWQGYAPLYDGLWVSPSSLHDDTRKLLTEVDLGTVTAFRARRLELATTGERDPLDAWDITAIAAQYDSFIKAWSPLLPQIRSGRITGAEAVNTRTKIVDIYRRFSVIDPELPLRLLPAGWPRRPARDVFEAVYDGLARAAEHHVRTVVARHAAGRPPAIQAHTVAELLAGVQPDLADADSVPLPVS
jgi:phenylacetic acid degradation operon negative regulatory protein